MTETRTMAKTNHDSRVRAMLAALATGILLMAAVQPVHASATFAVTNTNDSGTGSLRQAMLNANASAGADTIRFDIPGDGVHTISPDSALPAVTDTVTIDGYTQPGSSPNTLDLSQGATNGKPLIELNGKNAGSLVSGLNIAAPSTVIKGLVINNFGNNGISFHVNGSDVTLDGSDSRVEGNFIGTDPTGTLERGNGSDGVDTNGIGRITVGSNLSKAARNLISGNDESGVRLDGNGFSSGGDDKVLGNLIGTKVDGKSSLPNLLEGVDVSGASNNNISSNTIAFNGDNGIRIKEDTISANHDANSNGIAANSIFSNGRLGIDLNGDGVTPNEFLDLDQGPNNRQNFPVLNSARTADGATSIEGSFNSLPNTPFVLQFYSNPAGGDEGKKVVDEKAVTTDAQGNAFFTFTLARLVGAGQNITATARNTSPVRGSTADTSEFSAPVKVQDLTHPSVKTTVPAPNATGVSPTANITAAFSEAMKASTVNATTVTLKKAGTTKNLASTVSYASVSKKATLNPGASLVPGASYVAKVSTNAKDKAGNALDQNPSLSGNQAKIWKFTVKK